MLVIKNVLIEVADKAVPFSNFATPVYGNFDNKDYLGYAELEAREDGLYADFYLQEKPGEDQLWPAIGYSQNPDVINQIGLCYNKNVDPNIRAIRFDLLS